MTTKQIKLVRGLLAKAELTKYKADLVYDYSDGRTESLSEMTYKETQAIVKYLQDYTGDRNPADQMRRKILSMAHEMHWELAGGRIDMPRVNNWCKLYSGKNKPLSGFKYEELPTLVTQFSFAYAAFLKGI